MWRGGLVACSTDSLGLNQELGSWLGVGLRPSVRQGQRMDEVTFPATCYGTGSERLRLRGMIWFANGIGIGVFGLGRWIWSGSGVLEGGLDLWP